MHSNGKTILGHKTNDSGYKIIVKKIKNFSYMSNSMIFGGHFENMQIRPSRRHFSACQHWFSDSAYQITPNPGIKPFSSQNACTC